MNEEDQTVDSLEENQIPRLFFKLYQNLTSFFIATTPWQYNLVFDRDFWYDANDALSNVTK